MIEDVNFRGFFLLIIISPIAGINKGVREKEPKFPLGLFISVFLFEA